MLRQPWRLENRFTCISRQPWARPFPILDSVFLATHFKVEVLQSLISDLPGGLGVKNLLCNAWDVGSIPGELRSHMPWDSACHKERTHVTERDPACWN